MANAYGEAAVAAAKLSQNGSDPRDAWKGVVKTDKPCPKGTFLGLCEAGLIVGVRGAAPGTYTKPNDPAHSNKLYGEVAADLLREYVTPPKPDVLWFKVFEKLGYQLKKYRNQQMHVVIALWNAGLIRR